MDLHHVDNPPSHPELLELLGQEFAAHQFDIKWLIKELVLTETYQRSSLLPEGEAAEKVPETSYRTALEKPLSSEQLLYAMLRATDEWTRGTASDAETNKLRERFAKALANPPKEPETEFSPSVKAALFLSNDEVVLGWFQPRMGNLIERLTAVSDADALADELYLALLTRFPTDEEKAEVKELLARGGDRPCREFRRSL